MNIPSIVENIEREIEGARLALAMVTSVRQYDQLKARLAYLRDLLSRYKPAAR